MIDEKDFLILKLLFLKEGAVAAAKQASSHVKTRRSWVRPQKKWKLRNKRGVFLFFFKPQSVATPMEMENNFCEDSENLNQFTLFENHAKKSQF